MEGGRGPTGIRPKFGGEFRRRLVADPAVQPFLIPIPLVFRSQNFGLHERTEKFPVRELRFHPAVERFAVTVLPRTARCNIQRRDLSCFQPPLDRSRDELWPVVRTNRSRRAVLRFQPRQDRHYILRRHPPLHFQRQTLAREFVHHRKPFQSPSVACFVHGEIPAPYVVLVLRFLHRAAVFAVPASAFSPLPQRLPQAFLPTQPLHALPVNLPSFSPQQPGHPPIPRTRMLLRQLVQPLANFSFSIIGCAPYTAASSAAAAPTGKRSVPRSCARRKDNPPPVACPPGSPVFSVEVLQRVDVHGLLRHDLL